jgi:hypothetical protein
MLFRLLPVLGVLHSFQHSANLPLIAMELLFWAVVALAEGLAIPAVAERFWR